MHSESRENMPDPREKCIKEEIERELMTKKVKWLNISTFFIVVIVYISTLNISENEDIPFPPFFISRVIEIVGVNILNKYKPAYIKHFIGMKIVLAKFYVSEVPMYFFFEIASVLSMPLKLFFIEEKKPYFLISLIPQGIFLHKMGKSNIFQSLQKMNPETFGIGITLSFVVLCAYMLLTFSGIHQNFIYYHSKVLTSEREKNESQKQKVFILGFSHELRNLMNNIIGNIQVSMLEELSPKVQTCLNNAKICGDVLLQLVNNILDSGKIEIGQLEINPKSVDIYPRLADLWSVCHTLIKRNPNINANIYVSRKLPQRIKVDSLRLAQVIFNLISNSIKFTAQGYIKIKVDWVDDSSKVTDETFEPLPFNEDGIFSKDMAMLNFSNDYTNFDDEYDSDEEEEAYMDANAHAHRVGEKGILKISVLDSGSGIKPDGLEKIFQKFSQHARDTYKRQIGTGLGLFITKEICKASGGDIRAYSQEKKGSVFILCLPCEICPTYRTSSSWISTNSNVIRSISNCMIVEDDKMAQEVLETLFKKLNVIPLKIANNGKEAVEMYIKLIEQGQILDLISMDINMPIMDGKEAARKIREYEKSKKLNPVKIVMASANCDQSEICECLNPDGKIKATEFLKKPISFKELQKLIEKILKEEETI